MDISGFNPPAYGLIDDDPLLFKAQFQTFLDALAAHQDDAGDLERVASDLRGALSEREQQIGMLEGLAQQRGEAAAAAEAQMNLAVAAYRQARLNGDPSIPPALVEGVTVDEIDAAITKAMGVVEYVRGKIASPGGAGAPGETTPPAAPPRVPAGAPGRTLPDVAGMTAREKLVFGTSRLSV